MLHDVGEALALGLDSFILCAGLGLLWTSSRLKYGLVISFGCFDGLAGWLGHQIGHSPGREMEAGQALAAALIALYGLYVILVGSWGRQVGPSWAAVIVIPLVLSIDNFVAGSLSSTPVPVIGTALTSAAMACAGLGLGSGLGRVARWPLPRFAGSVVVASAIVMLLS